MNDTVSWAGLAVSLLLVAAAAGISWWQRLGLQRQILVAAVRALVQLLLVGAALTLVTQPQTLLLDEPTSALDAQPKQVFEATARELASQGITIIWVTHDGAQADRVADRIYQLRDGHLTPAAGEARP